MTDVTELQMLYQLPLIEKDKYSIACQGVLWSCNCNNKKTLLIKM